MKYATNTNELCDIKMNRIRMKFAMGIDGFFKREGLSGQKAFCVLRGAHFKYIVWLLSLVLRD